MEDEIKNRNRKRAEMRALKSFRDRSKEKMEVEIKKILLEATRKIEEFSMTYEEAMRTNQILSAQLISVQLFLKENQSDIELLAKDYSHTKEYISYCEMQRKSLELISVLLNQMV